LVVVDDDDDGGDNNNDDDDDNGDNDEIDDRATDGMRFSPQHGHLSTSVDAILLSDTAKSLDENR
jgi:hypothetical protein